VENIEKHIVKEHKYIPETAMYPTNISEAMQCYTDFEPRAEPKSDIGARIIPNDHKWKRAIFEEFLDMSILKKARSRGYLDYKYMYVSSTKETYTPTNRYMAQFNMSIDILLPGFMATRMPVLCR